MTTGSITSPLFWGLFFFVAEKVYIVTSCRNISFVSKFEHVLVMLLSVVLVQDFQACNISNVLIIMYFYMSGVTESVRCLLFFRKHLCHVYIKVILKDYIES